MDAVGSPGCRLALHADWSRHPAKRWMTRALRRDGAWHAEAPEPVGEPGSLLRRLRAQADDGSIAFGIDCPLGLPRAYVQRHPGPYRHFRDFLAALDDMPELAQVCATLDEVSALRPFYPQRGLRGMSRAAHAAALGLADASSLSRRCDRATATRAAGAPVFWTLGANQSGKAAISAWRDLVLPALREVPERLHLWPFDGDVAAWSSSAVAGCVMLAETYPAEALDQLRLRLRGRDGRGSKRRQPDRAGLSDALRTTLASLQVRLSARLEAGLDAGFGADAAGEDRFDSVLGLICVLSVLSGQRADHVPEDPWVRRWEGWVLGLDPSDRDRLAEADPGAGGTDVARAV
jgi:hypothetical protein